MVRFLGKRAKPKVLIVGLDCAGPQLVFDEFKADLPTLSNLMSSATWGELESSTPCITVPAWASMMSSRDPGVLGVYGFRNRANYTYDGMTTANSAAIKVKRLWDYVGDAGKESVLIGVPQTYPVQTVRGHMVSCLLTPGTESAFAYPAIFKQEVLNVAPNYQFDVKGFRTDDKALLLRQLYDMTEAQFALLKHTMTTKNWDLFMYVNIGVDRIHHGFWRYHDPQHRLHEQDSPFRHAIRDYYKRVDQIIGELVTLAGDDVTVLVVSDHGVKRMDGGICVNEWLWRNGWLALRNPPEPGKTLAFSDAQIDWSRTKAWASGGYYGRVFLNIQEREPEGVIPAAQAAAVRDELNAALKAIPAPDGTPLQTTVFYPENIYQQVNNYAPDLMVYFGDLHWRSVGGFGYESIYTLENDTGPDDANHAQHGMFILHEPRTQGRGQTNSYQLMDIAPTVLDRLGLPVPPQMQGRVIG